MKRFIVLRDRLVSESSSCRNLNEYFAILPAVL